MTIAEVWLAAGIVLFILEIFSLDFVLLSLGAAAFLAGVTAWFGAGWTGSIAAFAVAAVAALLFLRPFAVRKVQAKGGPTNAEALIGAVGYVTRPIDPLKGGRVRVGGDDWAARADEPLAKDTRVVVESIEGITLFVRRDA
ncbi:MAG: NfeD family protein [Clostridia bacterium]|nr:NfeD family protein [Clostridia bacterium]